MRDERAEDVNQAKILALVDLDVLELVQFGRKYEEDVSFYKEIDVAALIVLVIDVLLRWRQVSLQVQTHPCEEVLAIFLIQLYEEFDRVPDFVVDVLSSFSFQILRQFFDEIVQIINFLVVPMYQLLLQG